MVNRQNPAPEIDWRDYDSIVAPWLKGDRFPDQVPLGYWPLPEPDYLRSYPKESRLSYWALATTHFDQNDWLDKTAVVLENDAPGRVSTGDSIAMSAEAAGCWSPHGRLRVTVPLEDDQVLLARRAKDDAGDKVEPEHTARLQAARPSLVFNPPDRPGRRGKARRSARSTGCGQTCRGSCRTSAPAGTSATCGFGLGSRSCARPSLVTWGSAFPSWNEGDDPKQDKRRARRSQRVDLVLPRQLVRR